MGILIAIVYVVIAALVYLVAAFMDGRRLGKGEITEEKADSEVKDNALVAIFWPIALILAVVLAPFVLFYYIGNGVRKFGEYTTTRRNISSGDTSC